MDTARDKTTLELVEAEELWNMSVVDIYGYICRGCATQVYPASYDRKVNRKRPYFSLRTNRHKVGCDVDGETKIIKRAMNERVGTPEGFPLPFPSRITLSDERIVVPNGTDRSGGQEYGRNGSRAGTGAAPSRHHGHTVKTIRPACSVFIKYPHDRQHLPFTIPGVPGDTYARVFWHLRSKKPEHFLTPTHLYYAAIRYKAEPAIAEAYCELTLNAGEWNEEKRDYRSLSRVRIEWSSWSRSRRESLICEFEAAREEAAKQAKADRETKGWIFFVGTQDPVDPGVFRVDNHRLVCCLAAKMSWPTRK